MTIISWADTPTELWDYMIDFIEKTTDLLALCQVCKALRDVVIPDHLHSRRIRCGLHTPAFWKAFTENKHLISRVRTLEITPDRGRRNQSHRLAELVPPVLAGVGSEEGRTSSKSAVEQAEAMKYLADAVALMPQLTHFHFRVAVRPSNDLLRALSLSSTRISGIELLNLSLDSSPMRTSVIDKSKLWSLSNLTQFSYSERYEEFDVNMFYKNSHQIATLLSQCPQLEDIQLFFDLEYHQLGTALVMGDPLVKLLQTAIWPKLRRVSMESDIGYMFIENLLSNNRGIEAFWFSGDWSRIIRYDNLVKLRSLELDWLPSIDDMYSLPSATISQITHLTLKVSETYYIDEPDANYTLLAAATNLQSLVLRFYEFDGETMLNLARCIPRRTLQRFALDPILRSSRVYRTPVQGKGIRGAFVNILKCLPNLTHFSPIYLQFWSPYGAEDTDSREFMLDVKSVFETLIKLMPQLRFVGVIPNQSARNPPIWYKLDVNGDGTLDGFEEVGGRLRKDVDINMWGDLYRGVRRDVGWELE